VVPYARPFALGELRLELLPTGHLPGAAALACEVGGRRVLYAGAIRPGAPVAGAAPAAVRHAEALCLDAAFGHPRFRFVPHDEAMAAVVAFARRARDERAAPVVLAAPFGPAPELALALSGQGWRLRGNRAIVDAVAAYRRAGVALPPITRLGGPLAPDEVVLWPPTAPQAGQLGRLGLVRRVWVSGWACVPEAVARVGADLAIPYGNHADFEGLLGYALATGAREVALEHGFAEDFAAALRERGIDAYGLGPPRQIALFSGDGP
jgi:hypothetical protein